MQNCPTCGLAVDGLVCPACGTGSGPGTSIVDPSRFLCCDESQGQRCAAIGSLATTTHGFDGAKGNDKQRWYCAAHFPPFRAMQHGKQLPTRDQVQRLRELTRRVAPVQPPLDFEAAAERLALQDPRL